jgi:hypothetical protein
VTVIIDASVALKWFMEEPESDVARRILDGDALSDQVKRQGKANGENSKGHFTIETNRRMSSASASAQA